MKYIIFFCLSFCIFLSFYHTVFSKSETTFKISKNSQVLIDFSKHLELKDFYRKGLFKVKTSTGSDIQVLQRGNKLVLWYPRRKNIKLGNIIFSLKNERLSLPIERNIPEEESGLNIYNDMFHLSLQKRSLSCESSATSDILSTMLRKNIDEDEIISWLPKTKYYNKVPTKIGTQKVWGNPNEGFVGYIDHTEGIQAKQKKMTGYGVYEKPIAKVYMAFGLDTQILNKTHHSRILTPDIHLRFLMKKLQEGSMVQLWGDWCTKLEYDDGILENKSDIQKISSSDFISAKNTCYNVDAPREIQWKYYNKNGVLRNHTGLDGEHAFILLGWKGNISHPSHIRVWDTDTGYHEYKTVEWMRKWKKMDYRSIIISKKEAL